MAVAEEQGTLLTMNDPEHMQSLLWAEAKKGAKSEEGMYESIIQLILTIGRARTMDKYLPPKFLGAFDCEKIAFIPYEKVMEVFSQNDFNWNVTPSNHETKEFKQLYGIVKETLDNDLLAFSFDDTATLKNFIKNNMVLGHSDYKRIAVTKNNFVTVYGKWASQVKPSINLNFEDAKKKGIVDSDFFLADLLSAENATIIEKLFVLLKSDHYELDRKIDAVGFEESKMVKFNDKQKAHKKFWNFYERPPKEEYWDYIVDRRDLLVPQDIREYKGAYFTPQKWVELSQKYLAECLGASWQDEYYVWDCCAGTGNLLVGLTDRYKIFASTLDKADVEIMKERIKNGAALLEGHVFQFDFLNDDLFGEKVPESLKAILRDEEKRKRLLIYINPPYAEAASARQHTGGGEAKTGVSIDNATYEKYKDRIGNASNELFAQFLARIYFEISGCKIGQFSTTKHLQSPNFETFREMFKAKLKNCFLVPGNSFDNVKGEFPIGFYIWDTSEKEKFSEVMADAYATNEKQLPPKKLISYFGQKFINAWYAQFYDKRAEEVIGIMNTRGNDFQNYNYIRITSDDNHNHTNVITKNNLIESCIYLAVRHCIEATWLNDRDQFLWPLDGWQNDAEFQNDCLAFTLFHGQNRISAASGGGHAELVSASHRKEIPKQVRDDKASQNHWIPFTEAEVNSPEAFSSHFMSDFIAGKIKREKAEAELPLFGEAAPDRASDALQFSPEAKAVMDAGREIWRYYFASGAKDANASFYDIRAHFQGRNEKGRMNSTSNDMTYTHLLETLRAAQKKLAKKIAEKVYDYGFLK